MAFFAKAQSPGTPAENALRLQAFWIDRTTIAIPDAQMREDGIYKIFSDTDGHLAYSPNGLAGHFGIALHPGSPLTPQQLNRFSQLAKGYGALHFSSGMTEGLEHLLLKGQLAVSVQKPDGTLTYATGIQDAGVLDDLYGYNGALGVVLQDDPAGGADWKRLGGGEVQVRVWAPTAQSMALQLFDGANDPTPKSVVPMHEVGGVWTTALQRDALGKYYLLSERVYAPTKRAVVEHTVTDPYSSDISLNGLKSRLVDLRAHASMPERWEADRSPSLDSPNDLSIYELHVRDFSIADNTVPAEHRGMYLAFTDKDTDGMKHLTALAQAGLKAVHLLPTFHFSGVDEDKSHWKSPGDLTGYPPDGKQQQAAVNVIKEVDAYNWGYGPIHYLVPEGSYAVRPEDRVSEYRQMVAALHHTGLRVIQDIVFNHTAGFGEDTDSVLDKLVPNYYNRLDPDGKLYTATCCADTASEHRMMAKLQEDTLVWQAKQYHIDGFRFDLMGFTFVENLKGIRGALNALTLDKDGVDGSKIYLYGEGWDFGETANNALGTAATQLNLFGLGVGTFNDRIRDALRGGGVSGDMQVQGVATGLFTDPGHSIGTSSEQRKTLLHEEDLLKVSLAGNLRDFTFVDSSGNEVKGSAVLYNGHPAGYTAGPVEAINYDAAHDDLDLFDSVQIKSAARDDADVRARRVSLAMSVVLLGQGVPFVMGGEDMLRSKDMDHNSYNSGDWFNKIDWSGQGTNWGIGLPISDDDGTAWAIVKPLLSKPSLKPTPAQIQRTAAVFREWLKIRYSSPLFRMSTAEQVQQHLHFVPVETPGVIAMRLDGAEGPFRNILVVFNATMATQTVGVRELNNTRLRLHPVQADSADVIVTHSSFEGGMATVPALTTAVFVGER